MINLMPPIAFTASFIAVLSSVYVALSTEGNSSLLTIGFDSAICSRHNVKRKSNWMQYVNQAPNNDVNFIVHSKKNATSSMIISEATLVASATASS